MQFDIIKWHCAWDVHRWDEDAVAWLTATLGRAPSMADFEAARIDPYAVSHIDGNLLTTAGLTRLTALFTATGSTQALTNTSARIGVGDGTTAVAVGDTDLSALSGSTHRQFVIMDATYPSASAGVITARSTFTGTLGNFHWQEFGIDIGTPTVANATTVNACLVNHKLSDQGTKTSGQSWTATATITIA